MDEKTKKTFNTHKPASGGGFGKKPSESASGANSTSNASDTSNARSSDATVGQHTSRGSSNHGNNKNLRAKSTGAGRSNAGNNSNKSARQPRNSGEQRERPRKNTFRKERIKPEFEQRIINIRRVTRVVAGGRRFNFSVCIALGDKKGRVGVGIGKAGDTALAIEKASRDAKRHMVKIPMTKNNSILHPVASKYCASLITISPAPGRGLVAGSAVRNMLELAGITDCSAKILSRSKNHLNNARCTVDALLQTVPKKSRAQ